MRESKVNVKKTRKTLFKMPHKLDMFRCYLMYCDKCGKTVYSDFNQGRYDFIKDLVDNGWKISLDYPENRPSSCPKCYELEKKAKELKKEEMKNESH